MKIIIIMLCLAICVPVYALKGLSGLPVQHHHAASIAQAHGLDSLLVWAVIQVESAWDSLARSSEGCLGLMQINPPFHGNLPDSQYFRSELSLEIGCAYLRKLLTMFDGDLSRSLTGYNYGEYHSVTRRRGTSSYSDRVLSLYTAWQKELGLLPAE